jgi:endonuclease YncB( thermonuclease family)
MKEIDDSLMGLAYLWERLMKKALQILSFVLAWTLVFPALLLAGQFKVVEVYDGDTLRAKGFDIEIKVRLAGIDAPEMPRRKAELGQPYYQKAKNYLEAWGLNETVDIKGYGLDRFNQILGVIRAGTKDINLELIRAGMAEVDRGNNPPKGLDLTLYRKAEKMAREEKRGMWMLGSKYTSPRIWRKRHGVR